MIDKGVKEVLDKLPTAELEIVWKHFRSYRELGEASFGAC